MEHLLIGLVVTIGIATIINVYLKKLDIPTVIGYIVTGFAIAQIFHFADTSKETLAHLAEFGIVFLMFTIGLEFSISQMRSMKKEVFVYGALQVILSGLLFTFLAFTFFDITVKNAIVIGMALSLSSTAIVLKILNENGDIHTGYGRVVLGILLFQDLAVIPMLLMISIFTSTNASVGELLLETVISAAIVFVILFVVGKYFIERFFDWVTSSESEEIFLASVILTVIAASVLAEQFGFSYSLGAFLAGMTIAETKYRYRIEADLVPFRDILLGIFFVTIGMQINLDIVSDFIFTILGLLLAMMLIKALVLFLVMRLFMQNRSAIKSALALMQVGEFALAIFALANSYKIISDQTNQIMIVTIVLSMILTPFILKNIKFLADLFFAEPVGLRERALVSTGYKDHIIICGYGPVGKMLVERFKKNNVLYVILEHDVKLVDEAIASGEENIFLANAAQKSVLEHFDIKKSLAIFSAVNNPHQVRLICENINSFGADINSVVTVKNKSQEESIADLNITHVLNRREAVTDILAKQICAFKKVE
ncbi:MAG: Glutathione-regulated potassium-efflux system protein KefB [uncultured Sulfurovum sp.]|uniref:Glutathione-regulated potassium-efflux system protein KefB n=1 Tax=uncultured Sulfurovum sp. TaxID=269237 RepID=A0A6S6TL24_9BACT|nr:MAG: Glutathione-regulated potassium-efflux system protein KefB [uncultured Sulfurovum sp.]